MPKISATPRSSGDRSYYVVVSDYNAMRAGTEYQDIVNEDTMYKDRFLDRRAAGWREVFLVPPSGPWRFPEYVEVPRFLVKQRDGRKRRDFAMVRAGEPWVVTPAFKTVLESIDPDSCEFRRCDSILPGGQPGPEIWLFSVTRVLQRAVETEGAVELRRHYLRPDALAYRLDSMYSRLSFRSDVIGNAHVFHLGDVSVGVICDDCVKIACKKAGLKGIAFQPISINARPNRRT